MIIDLNVISLRLSMSDKKGDGKDNFNEKDYEQMMIRKRIMDHEMKKINQMNLRQIIQKQRKNQPTIPPSPTLRHVHQNLRQKLKQAGFQDDLQTISERQIQLFDEAEKKNRQMRKQMKKSPILSQIKRGKLGTDLLLISFAAIGSLLLPFIIYERFRDNRSQIVKGRKISPEVIENLDEDSPISLDSVSEQAIMYDNPDRMKEIEMKRQLHQKVRKLERQLDL